MAPARQSNDCADLSHAESEFLETILKSLGPPLQRLLPGLSPASTMESWTGSDSGQSPAQLRIFRTHWKPRSKRRWERYLKEGVLKTADLSFSTPSWAGAASRPLLLSRQPEAWHPSEANSVPPGFTRINRKTQEEQEATRYETPTNSEQSIDEELGIQDVMNINEGWYARSESELASAIDSILQQPMEVDEAPEEQSYQMFDEEAPDVFGPDPGPGSPVTATEDRVLNMPGRFSRAPGDGRPITRSGAGSSG